MKRITAETIRSAYSHMGYQPCRGEWRREEPSPAGQIEPMEMACPQTTILELTGLISHDEEGPNIETAADDEWGTDYANGFRDGWDGLDAKACFATDSPQNRTEYDLGYEDGQAAASELLPASVDASSTARLSSGVDGHL